MKQVVNSTLLDFQVRAKTGNYTVVYKQSGATTYFNDSDTSNWSNLQTVDLSRPLDPTTYLLPIIIAAIIATAIIIYGRSKASKNPYVKKL